MAFQIITMDRECYILLNLCLILRWPFSFGPGFCSSWLAYLMASKLQKLQATASQASQFVSSRGTNYYRQLLEQNKQHIQEPPTVEKCNLLAKQLFYTRLARLYFVQLTPPPLLMLCLAGFTIWNSLIVYACWPSFIDFKCFWHTLICSWMFPIMSNGFFYSFID